MDKRHIELTLNPERVLSLRENGYQTRKNLHLDILDMDKDLIVNITVPQTVFSLNASFFIGCFGPSIKKLGEFGFRKKYIFNCDQVIKKCVEDGISRSLFGGF